MKNLFLSDLDRFDATVGHLLENIFGNPFYLAKQCLRYSAQDSIVLANLWDFMVRTVYVIDIPPLEPNTASISAGGFMNVSRFLSKCITNTSFAFGMLRHVTTAFPFTAWNQFFVFKPRVFRELHIPIGAAEYAARRCVYGGRTDGRTNWHCSRILSQPTTPSIAWTFSHAGSPRQRLDAPLL